MHTGDPFAGSGDRSDAAYSDAGSIFDLLERPEWMSDAACREHPEVNWFPTRGDALDVARAICAGCLVRSECAAYGRREQFGIWGGLSINDRKGRRPKRAAA